MVVQVLMCKNNKVNKTACLYGEQIAFSMKIIKSILITISIIFAITALIYGMIINKDFFLLIIGWFVIIVFATIYKVVFETLD
jgi:hypothetical protein